MSDEKPSNNPVAMIWQLFISVKLTVPVLLVIAVTAAIGTVIPQNQPEMFYQMNFSETSYRIFSALDLFDMYSSLWFQALILVLALNIIACSISRLKIVWKIVFPSKKTFSAKSFSQKNTTEPVTINALLEMLKTPFEKKLSNFFSTTHFKKNQDGFFLFAEKGRLSRLGVYVVHLSVLLLLSGTLITSIGGFEGSVNIPEQETSDTILLRNSSQQKKLDFTIRCDNFEVSFYESGRPKEYRSTLSIIDNEEVVLTRDIVVNKPLHYKGISIFQSSYGAASVKTAKLHFISKKSGMTYHRTLAIGDSINLPEDLGTFSLDKFTDRYIFMEQHDLGESLVGTLQKDDKTTTVVLPVKFHNFDKMRQGDIIVTIEDLSRTFYTGLQVRRDPGVPVVYASFILMIVGIYITFFMSHIRLCVHAIGRENQTIITVATKANKNKLAAQRKAEAISKVLAQAIL